MNAQSLRRVWVACLVAVLLAVVLVWLRPDVPFNCNYFQWDPFCWWYS